MCCVVVTSVFMSEFLKTNLVFLASDQIQVEFFFFFHINIFDDILKDKNNSLMINVK